MRLLKYRISSFKNAFSGIFFAFRTQNNLWIHLIISILVVLMGLWLALSVIDWAILILTMAMVFAAEMFNTSIEAVVDLIQPAIHPLAKTGKDVAAAAVLLTAISSIFIGILILGPPLCRRLGIYIFP